MQINTGVPPFNFAPFLICALKILKFFPLARFWLLQAKKVVISPTFEVLFIVVNQNADEK